MRTLELSQDSIFLGLFTINPKKPLIARHSLGVRRRHLAFLYSFIKVFGGSEVFTGMNYISLIACPFMRELLIKQTFANLVHHCMEAIPR